jgi:phage FluMu protein Com
MPKIERSSDVVEVHSEHALTYGVIGIGLAAFSSLLIYYRGESGVFVPFAALIMVGAVGCILYALYRAFRTKKVVHSQYRCPYCDENNALTSTPEDDFRCVHCNRLIPVQDGEILPVSQVRCGFCSGLNYFSEKTDVLLCEECNREVPIAHEEGHVSKKSLPTGFAVEDDLRPYELILVDPGAKTDALISALQHMLALNRNQVKLMLNEAPVTLLTGVPKKKAEMLRAQLSIHNATADCKPMSESMI